MVFPENLKSETNYLYVLDLINHFSKWEYSFLLKNKESKSVVSKIKAFIEMNEKPILFHNDNGKEFDNLELKMPLENNNIKYIKSAQYHPQSNGCCEALHKEIKKCLLDDLEELKENFDIDVSIENAINFHIEN